MTYKRKTRDEFNVQQNFGYGHGWEDVSAYGSRRDAQLGLKEYRENQPEYPVRIVVRRIPIQS